MRPTSSNGVYESLQWRPPRPEHAVLDPCPFALPLALAVLRDAACASWSLPQVRTEPLIKYLAALQVVRQKRPDLMRGVKQEQAHVASALAYAFSAQPGGQAGHAAASVSALGLAGMSGDWVRLAQLQYHCSHEGEGGPRAMARAYETCLAATHHPVVAFYVRTGLAYWQSETLLEAAPEPIHLADEPKTSIAHVRLSKQTRERHYHAALGVLEDVQRMWKASDKPPVCVPLMEAFEGHVQEVQLLYEQVKRDREAHDGATAHFDPVDWDAIALLSLGDEEEKKQESTAAFGALDKLLLQETDKWSVTEAAASVQVGAVPTVHDRSYPHLLSQCLGMVDAAAVPDMVTGRVAAVAVMAAISARMELLTHGHGNDGLSRERNLMALRAIRDKLHAKLV